MAYTITGKQLKKPIKFGKADLENYLNEAYIGEKPAKVKKYGTWLRKNDPKEFQENYNRFIETLKFGFDFDINRKKSVKITPNTFAKRL